jgi:hypothetical protein
MAMSAKVEVEDAPASREVGKRLARESEACLGKGWSTALYVSNKGTEGSLKIGLVGTRIELVSRIFLTRQHSMNTGRHSFHPLMRGLTNDAVCASRASTPRAKQASK